jgi:hypothetical protein
MALDKTQSKTPFVVETTPRNPSLQQTINTTSNWTVPANVNEVWIHAAGGGGGGGGKDTASAAYHRQAGSGGSGYFTYAPVTPGETVAITIGSGGTGNTAGSVTQTIGAGGPGGTGGTTIITIPSSITIRCPGGWGGGTGQQANGNWMDMSSGYDPSIAHFKLRFGSENAAFYTFDGSDFNHGGERGGASGPANWNQTNNAAANGTGGYGGAPGGKDTGNGAGSVGQTGGTNNYYGYTGGAGVTGTANTGGGGGGAGIAGNGGAASGSTGGTGGAGGGGGGAGGSLSGNVGTGGTGGAGVVLIYYV